MTHKHAYPTTCVARRALPIILIPVLAAMGCRVDPRVSFDEFMRIQKQFESGQVMADSNAAPADAAAAMAAQAATPSSIDEQIAPYRVGAGDVLVVTMSGFDLSIPSPIRVRVNRAGQVVLPTVGPVAVTGRELEDVETAIQKAFVPAVVHDLTVIVDVEKFESTHVLVLGAVTGPGLIPLRRTESNMLFAIAAAGGVSQAASGRATLRRVGSPMGDRTFNLTNPTELEEALSLPPLQDGDIIEVEAAEPNTVYVGGLVSVSGPQSFPAGVRPTYLQVMAAAGGVRTDLFPRWGTLIRRMPDGRDLQVKLSLERLAAGKDDNFRLAGGDILWVPHTFSTRAQEWFNRNVFLRFGGSANVTYNVSGVEYLNRRDQQSGRGSSRLEDAFDPYGFLQRNAILQTLPGAR